MQKHIFVQPEDGGGLMRYCHDQVPQYVHKEPGPTVEPSDWKEGGRAKSSTGSLPLKCHCGGFKASVKRPSACEDQTAHIFQYIEDDKWRWSLDFCTSCRTTTGEPLSCFIFLSPQAILLEDGTTPLTTKALAHYQSSPGVFRSFCPVCGAKAFYQNTNKQVVDRVVEPLLGLVDIPLKEVLECWVKRVEDVSETLEEAAHQDLAHSVVDGWKRSAFA